MNLLGHCRSLIRRARLFAIVPPLWLISFSALLFAGNQSDVALKSGVPADLQELEKKHAAEIASILTRCAASANAKDQDRVRQALGSQSLLLRLNSADEYARMRPDQLRVAGVLTVLATNDSPDARRTLGFLAENHLFLDDLGRQDQLLRAVAQVRPVTPAIVRFFDEQTRPDAANLHLAIACLVINGSKPATDLIEKKLSDPGQEPENVQGWMRDSILSHRNDAPLLESCETLLKGAALSQTLKQTLVEALFDYQPDRWYPPDSNLPQPPDRALASPASRATLRSIGQWVSQQNWLPIDLRNKVREQVTKLN